jgi:uncharacterized membrane protein
VTDSKERTREASEAHPKPRARTHFRRILLTGLVILVPVTLTVYILKQIFDFMDGIFTPVIDKAVGVYLPGFHIPGLGLLLTLLVVLLLGWLSANVVGRRLIQGAEAVICRIPVAKSIYSATKGVLEAVSFDQSEAFQRVVLIEYPKENIFALAFVTKSASWPNLHPKTSDILLVFVPTTPNPTSGFLLVVPRAETIPLPISVEQGIRMVISGGILLPDLSGAKAVESFPPG